MTDSIAIFAQNRVDSITANTIAEATRSYGKRLPFDVQAKLCDLLAELKDDIEAGLRAEQDAFADERSYSDMKAGGTD
jgi:hypothetical protein